MEVGMSLLEGYNLLVLVVCWAGMLGLLYMAAAVDWRTPIEPKKITALLMAWWNRRIKRVMPSVIPEPPRWHKWFDDPV
jgi:hypothetical protein